MQTDEHALRQIARRVEHLVAEHRFLAHRLGQSWQGCVALHKAYLAEKGRREKLQRDFALSILRRGLLDEPRLESDSSWDREMFFVRVHGSLVSAQSNAKTDEEKRRLSRELAIAAAESVDRLDRINACTDKEEGERQWKQMDAEMPVPPFIIHRLWVGFRPRPEFRMEPHPLSCKWTEFQRLPLATKKTVAFVTLLILHDRLAVTPILDSAAAQCEDSSSFYEAIIVDATQDWVDPTVEAPNPAAPPVPSPRRLPVSKAKAFLALLEQEVRDGALDYHLPAGALAFLAATEHRSIADLPLDLTTDILRELDVAGHIEVRYLTVIRHTKPHSIQESPWVFPHQDSHTSRRLGCDPIPGSSPKRGESVRCTGE